MTIALAALPPRSRVPTLLTDSMTAYGQTVVVSRAKGGIDGRWAIASSGNAVGADIALAVIRSPLHNASAAGIAAVIWQRSQERGLVTNAQLPFSCLLVDGEGCAIYHLGSDGSTVRVDTDYGAIGGGDEAAMGALLGGADPRTALDIAYTLNSTCRGPTREFVYTDGLWSEVLP